MKIDMNQGIKKELSKKINWEKVNNLIPAIIQNSLTGTVLMLGYMNSEALEKTLSTGNVWFYSRTKQRLWMKGEESKNTLTLKNIALDCDGDTLLIQAEPQGPTCHTGEMSCFARSASTSMAPDMLSQLYATIQQRQRDLPAGSYTTELFTGGIPAIAAKVAEESAEVIQAAESETEQRVIEEASDVLYHLFVLCAARNVTLQNIQAELEKRSR